MTLTSEELRTSWVWKHRWQILLVSLFIWVLSASGASLGPPMPSSLYIPFGIVNMVPIPLLVRLAQCYYAPKQLKKEAMN